MFEFCFNFVSFFLNQSNESGISKTGLKFEKKRVMFTMIAYFFHPKKKLLELNPTKLGLKPLIKFWIILRSRTHLNEIYFPDNYFPTIRVRGFHSIHFIRNSLFRRSFLVLVDCKMPLPLGHVQLSWFFFFISLKAFLMLKNQSKIKSLHRLLLDVKETTIGFSSKS